MPLMLCLSFWAASVSKTKNNKVKRRKHLMCNIGLPASKNYFSAKLNKIIVCKFKMMLFFFAVFVMIWIYFYLYKHFNGLWAFCL